MCSSGGDSELERFGIERIGSEVGMYGVQNESNSEFRRMEKGPGKKAEEVEI